MTTWSLGRGLGSLALLGACVGCSANNQDTAGMTGQPGVTGTGTGGTTGMNAVVGQTGGTSGAPVGNGNVGAGGNTGGTGTTPGAGGAGMMPGTGGAGAAGMMAAATGGMGAAGMDGTGGMGAAGMGAAGADDTPTGPMMPCLTAGSDLLLIGDSYIDAPTYLTPALEAKATADGQLPAGQYYNSQAVAGTVSTQIKNQWDANKSPAPKFVVMDGGGNDILIGAPQCITASGDDPTCQGIVDMANATMLSILQDEKASGVKGVVYFFYPHTPIASGGTVVDYSLPKAKANCDSVSDDTFQCVFVNTQPALDDPGYYLDRIHPTANGGPDVLAGLVWDAMKSHCIGQTSGCCAP